MVQAHLHSKALNQHTSQSLPALCGRLFHCRLHHIRRSKVSRIPGHFGPREHLSLQVRALYVRIHTLTLKFLQGHT